MSAARGGDRVGRVSGPLSAACLRVGLDGGQCRAVRVGRFVIRALWGLELSKVEICGF